MLFHSRLKVNLLCAVLLFRKIIFNRTTRLLSYQLHQLGMEPVKKNRSVAGNLLYRYSHLRQAVLNLTACLLPAGRGWHALYIWSAVITDLFRAGSHTTFTLCWALHDGISGGARWKMCVAALRYVVSSLTALVDSAALILHCKVAREFQASA